MAAPKILGLTDSCGKCPRYVYYSGGRHKCVEVDQIVLNPDQIAPFCPLADHPSEKLASLEMTVVSLRQTDDYGLAFAILSYIGKKFKRNLVPSGSGLIFEPGDKKVYLTLDRIIQISLSPVYVRFVSNEEIFDIFPDAVPPLLRKQVAEDRYEHFHLR